MKKYILLITIFLPIFLFGQNYMGQIEPYEEYSIYSQASGQIVTLDKKDETKTVNKILIKIDDNLEKKQLALYENQLKLYNEKLKILESSYERFITIKGKSQSDRDEKYYDLIDLKISIDSLKLSISELKDTIAKKSIYVNNLYIKSFAVNLGDYVSIGTKLATAQDLTKAKVEVYVSSDDYKNIVNKTVLIDGKSDIATIEKIDKSVDETYVSAYKVTIVLKDKTYGKVVNVEFK